MTPPNFLQARTDCIRTLFVVFAGLAFSLPTVPAWAGGQSQSNAGAEVPTPAEPENTNGFGMTTVAVGRQATAGCLFATGTCGGINAGFPTGEGQIAIGNQATSTGAGSVAIGANSNDGGVSNVVSVGGSGIFRRITNVAAGINSTDAATVGQLNAAIASVSGSATDWSSAIDAARVAAINTSAVDATGKANNAQATAISVAATDAMTKANNAQAAAIAAAAIDATSKASNAQSAAINAAAIDATMKADNAQAAAETYADVVGMAANAYTDDAAANAVAISNTYTDNAVSAAITTANDYTDAAASNAIAVSKNYTDDSVASEAARANSYTDSAAENAVTISNNYTDEVAETTLNVANFYTDEKTKYLAVRSELAASSATGLDSIAVGGNAVASAENAIAVGSGAQATGQNAIAIGANALATGSVAIGDSAMAGDGGTAIGDMTTATGFHSLAGGYGAAATGESSSALGENAQATADNSVALGANAVATRGATTYVDPISGSAVLSVGEVSVGTAGAERQITNVAAGSAPTDAANVGQVQSAELNAVTTAGVYTDNRVSALSRSTDLQIEDAVNRANRHTDQAFARATSRTWAVAAQAAALANMPQSPYPGKSTIGMAIGQNHNQTAFAFGASYFMPNNRVIVKTAAAYNPDAGFTVGGGVAYVFP